MDAHADATRRGTALYRWLWRWHFFAGLFVAPFLVLLALTGGLYLFADEIEGWWYRDLARVEASAKPVAPEAQERALLAAYPGARIARYTAPREPTRAAEWQLRSADGAARTVFVDPGTGALRGALDSEWRLMTVISGLHGELLLGRFGDTLVELAACWTFILLVTGLFLWWPRHGAAGGVFLPRVRARGRLLLRDLHAVPAAWNALFVAFLVLSGLPWSGFWGDQLARLGTVSPALAPTPNFGAAPITPTLVDVAARVPVHEHDLAPGDLPWAIRKAGVPEANGGAARIDIADVMTAARARGLEAPGLRVLYPQRAQGVFTISFVPETAQRQRTVHLDPSSGAVIEDIGWREYSALGKAVELGVETHLGEQFGLANRLVLAASCVVIIATVVLGFLTWWRRRPTGELAAPPRSPGFAPSALVVGVAIALGVLFPLAGASMLAVLAFDVLSRWVRRASA